MSGFTGTMFESLYSYAQAATTTTPTAGAVTITGGYPSIEIPGNFFVKTGKYSSTTRLKLRGQLTTTATIPTWLFGLAWTQGMPATFATANVLAATAAFTPGVAATGAWFDLEADITLRTLGLGAASVLLTAGYLACPGAFPAATYTPAAGPIQTLPATNVSGASTASIDCDQPLFIWPYLTLGAATAGNTVSLQKVKMWGEN